MRNLQLLGITFALLVLILAGCDASGDDTSGEVSIQGFVVDEVTSEPLSNAIVRIQPINSLLETDEEGQYATTVQVDSVMDLTLTATKEGYSTEIALIVALGGRDVEVPTFVLTPLLDAGPISGKASSILLLSESDQQIGIKETGSDEVAEVVFQVADSLGRPINLGNKTEVIFTLGAQPGGGEYIFPERAETDYNGEVAVNLASGTRAGTVQIVAETTVDGRLIRSLPVSVAIHGGLPDQTHFSLGPERFNFPGLRRYGLTNPISVIVGDKYGNPVRTGTAVYFTTDHAVIEGSVETNTQGRGTVDLISANPLPADGVAVVTASTADEDQNIVSDQAAIVLSGVPFVSVTPTFAALNQTYQLTVRDQNNNPLVGGTTIQVNVQGTRVKGVGNVEVQLDDTAFIGGLAYENILRGPGITEFTFVAVPNLTLEETGEPRVEAIAIRVSGENGRIEIVLSADGTAPYARTEGTIMQMEGNDTAVFTLEEKF